MINVLLNVLLTRAGAVSLLACQPAARDPISGRQALHIAAEAGHASVVERLLTAGVSVLSVDKNEDSVFHIAARRGHVQVFLSAARLEAESWRKYKVNEFVRSFLGYLVTY